MLIYPGLMEKRRRVLEAAFNQCVQKADSMEYSDNLAEISINSLNSDLNLVSRELRRRLEKSGKYDKTDLEIKYNTILETLKEKMKYDEQMDSFQKLRGAKNTSPIDLEVRERLYTEALGIDEMLDTRALRVKDSEQVALKLAEVKIMLGGSLVDKEKLGEAEDLLSGITSSEYELEKNRLLSQVYPSLISSHCWDGCQKMEETAKDYKERRSFAKRGFKAARRAWELDRTKENMYNLAKLLSLFEREHNLYLREKGKKHDPTHTSHLRKKATEYYKMVLEIKEEIEPEKEKECNEGALAHIYLYEPNSEQGKKFAKEFPDNSVVRCDRKINEKAFEEYLRNRDNKDNS
jgi:hypothetical protein